MFRGTIPGNTESLQKSSYELLRCYEDSSGYFSRESVLIIFLKLNVQLQLVLNT